MEALFVELPAFERYRPQLLDDEDFSLLQRLLLMHPHAGDVIKGTGGLRKVRFADTQRHKGKRGGTRIIYYWWSAGQQFWLFTLYGKDVQDDLTAQQRQALKHLLEREYLMRTTNATQHLH
ncbi:toxin [Pseudomonas sichuanensis]|uniref:toxin n=1 Tax=Pseudomonas sichuanensis TaxID=2213015 RepID=UPI00244D4BFE|nr:toxin [Pseudomonas sichuanensis]MDH0730265.1 toxin [Pseudomonas sichuanensis]MDH1582349.1 toxin [Pseudomonas sichuanensis]MDH1591746.1 toxin [Pseudomonas sichuanensis]MDH1599543.1 toxin [Pseudomonas sichuanensis]